MNTINALSVTRTGRLEPAATRTGATKTSETKERQSTAISSDKTANGIGVGVAKPQGRKTLPTPLPMVLADPVAGTAPDTPLSIVCADPLVAAAPSTRPSPYPGDFKTRHLSGDKTNLRLDDSRHRAVTQMTDLVIKAYNPGAEKTAL